MAASSSERDRITDGGGGGLAALRRQAQGAASAQPKLSVVEPAEHPPKRRGRKPANRTRRHLSLPHPIAEKCEKWQRQREDLVVQALNRLYNQAFDGALSRPLSPFGAGTQSFSFSLTPATWSKVDRLSEVNAWSTSATIAALLHHYDAQHIYGEQQPD